MYRIGQEEIDALARTLMTRDFFKINNSGQEVLRFEEEWKQAMGKKYALLMTSGFAALVSGLIGMGIGPGDEVIVPAYTYIATALAVLQTGALPVIADTDETLTLSAADCARKISARTKAVIPVHIQGFPSDMDGLRAVCEKRGIRILEDACQAAGGAYHGVPLGSVGDAGAYSFNYFKMLTAGEGGALTTDDRTIHERALIYHDASAVAFFGSQLDGIGEPLFGGTEFRVSDLTGAILREQLKRMPGIRSDLKRLQNGFRERLEGKLTVAPSHDPDGDCGTTLALRFETAEETRRFAAHAAAQGIGLTVPIDTGKHVYTNWTQVMEKRGALHPLMDPYKMEANRGTQDDYTSDMCQATLDLLSRTAYLAINPDWSESDAEKVAGALLSF
ncbi:MAG: DegT/DnrJ/EryC1/StrS family aminotransferase [Clostridia bacterium]|nr:DegT/DnrJ/EryC1/StrS family aminotransferase [Clostridia bacterium]